MNLTDEQQQVVAISAGRHLVLAPPEQLLLTAFVPFLLHFHCKQQNFELQPWPMLSYEFSFLQA